MKLLISITLLILPILGLLSTSAEAKAQDCKVVDAIFARGSGQSLNKDEAGEFYRQLNARLPSLQQYELGSAKYNNAEYPAVSVDPLTHFGHLFGAWMSGGLANDYGRSVNQGITELTAYLGQAHQQCPDTQFVLGGYSQGAQVVGQSLGGLSSEIRSHIAFVALFGDPKLNLPEGRGWNPPACRNQNLSVWRREVPDCDTDNGSLGARDPYLPTDMQNRTGLWCNDDDVVCGSSINPFVNDGHDKYHANDGPIDHAVLEVAKRVQQKLSPPQTSETEPPIPGRDHYSFNLHPILGPTLPVGPDVMMVAINSGDQMSRPTTYSAFATPLVTLIETKVIQSGGRFGVVASDGCPGGSGQHVFSIVGDDYTAVHYWLAPAAFSQCNTLPQLQDMLFSTRTTTEWKNGAKKFIILVTDSSYSTLPLLSRQALTHLQYSISLVGGSSPFQVYVMAPTVAIAQSYNDMNIDGVVTSPLEQSNIDSIVDENTLQPQLVAHLSGSNIVARLGDSITFDATPSEVYDDTITGYDWDFNDDGAIDDSTTHPIIQHSYSGSFTGKMRVIVRSKLLSSSATESVAIKTGDLFPKKARPPVDLTVKKTSDTNVHLSWSSAGGAANAWAISLNGVALGQVKGEQTYVNISDVQPTQDNIFTVQAVATDSSLGDPASVVLASGSPITTLNSAASQVSSQTFSKDRISRKSFGGLISTPGLSSLATTFPSSGDTAKPNSSRDSLFLFFVTTAAFLLVLTMGLHIRKVSRQS